MMSQGQHRLPPVARQQQQEQQARRELAFHCAAPGAYDGAAKLPPVGSTQGVRATNLQLVQMPMQDTRQTTSATPMQDNYSYAAPVQHNYSYAPPAQDVRYNYAISAQDPRCSAYLSSAAVQDERYAAPKSSMPPARDTPMPVDEAKPKAGRIGVLVDDKPKIVFHAAMMAVQNFGFFTMYFDTWGDTPDAGVCHDTRFWVAFMAMTCFCEAFLCIGMGFGGYTDDAFVFPLYFLAHLVGGGCYTLCTVAIPLARYSSDGKECAALSPVNGDRIQLVYIMHAALYLVYVGGMLSILFFSYLKPKRLQKKKVSPAA